MPANIITMRPSYAADNDFLFRLFCSATEGKFDLLNLPAVEKEQLLTHDTSMQRGSDTFERS